MSEKSDKEGIFQYFTSKVFFKQLLFIVIAFIMFLVGVQLWLRFYTHHGQKLEMPDFVSENIYKAEEIAKSNHFRLVVSDSIFIVGKKGGIIMDQNPKAGSLVKENRKVYVTITKYDVETVRTSDLPVLYGNPYEQKKTELKYQDIESKIRDFKYDPGEPNHILEVYYNNQLIFSRDQKLDDILINKGDTLEFVISRKDGGDVTIPDLRCKTLEEARFILESSKLTLGDVVYKSESDDDHAVYVISQSPPYDGITNIKMGDRVALTVSTSQPLGCY